MELQRIVGGLNVALKRLHTAATDDEAAKAERELEENHLPALDAEDPAMGTAARATLVWMRKDREEALQRRRASTSST